MPTSVIDTDKLNNMYAKMGTLSIPMMRIKRKVRKARKIKTRKK